jgi:hypothetical protein
MRWRMNLRPTNATESSRADAAFWLNLQGVGPARRPSTRRIGASGLRDKPTWCSLRLKAAAIWRISAEMLPPRTRTGRQTMAFTPSGVVARAMERRRSAQHFGEIPMRSIKGWVAATFVTAALLCTSAQATPLANQVQAAAATFGYGSEMLDATVEGKWFPESASPSDKSVDEYAQVACTKNPTTITMMNPFQLEFVRKSKNGELDTIYTNIGTHEYAVFANAQQVASFLGLGAIQAGNHIFSTAIRSENGTATIEHPSPDVLVITMNDFVLLLARCPQ